MSRPGENSDSTRIGAGTKPEVNAVPTDAGSSSQREDRRPPERTAPAAMLCWDERLRLLDCGARWVEWLGWSVRQLREESGAELFAEQDWPRVVEAARQVRETGRSAVTRVTAMARDGSRHPLELELHRMGAEGRRLLVGLGTVGHEAQAPTNAITDAQALRQQQSSEPTHGEQELRRAARDIAHEFNNLLTTIRGACRVMRLDDELAPLIVEDIGEIEQASHRATALVRALTALGHGWAVSGPGYPTTGPPPASPRADDDDDDDDDLGGAARTRPGGEPSATVLLVDDEAGARRVVERMLQEGGYRVLSAGSGARALQISETHPDDIDLLLTDVMMPGMDGQTLYRTLQAQRGSLRVLFMSGYTDESIELTPHEDGVAFIPKPFLMDALLDSIRRLLTRA